MNIIPKPSPNQEGRKGNIPCLIVNHITGGDKVSSALNWFANPASQTSSNYIVDTNGDIYECVPIGSAAWANGTSISAGNKVYYGNATNPVVLQKGGNANLYSVSIEHVNAVGSSLTAKQLEATIQLHRHIVEQVQKLYGFTIPIDRDHISGHSDICPKSRPDNACPGKQFPFDKILEALSDESNGEKSLDVSWDASTVTLPVGKSYDALCIPRTLPDKAYYPGGEARVTNSSVIGMTKVVRKYTSRKGQVGDLYTIQAFKAGESRLIANVAGKTSSVLVKVVSY